MNHISVVVAGLVMSATLVMSSTSAVAGGIDRTGQSISALFEQGNYLEFSIASVAPNVSGTGSNASFNGQASSGNVTQQYLTYGFAYKIDVGDKVSLAMIVDQPFGADIDYDEGDYALYESAAEIATTSLTVLGQYHINDRMSVYAGPRLLRASGVYTVNNPSNGIGVDYTSTYSQDTDVGYVIGAAYEITDIALRAALTYSSQTEFSMDGTAGDLTATMPRSVNLDFQTGVAANTLVFAGIRWADWSEATIDDSLAGNLADFNNQDVFTYTLGVGRKFSEKVSGQISVSYEVATNELASNLSPTDGLVSISIGAAYALGNGVKLSGGVQYAMLGDATTTSFSSEFTDNSAIAVGMKVSYSF